MIGLKPKVRMQNHLQKSSFISRDYVESREIGVIGLNSAPLTLRAYLTPRVTLFYLLDAICTVKHLPRNLQDLTPCLRFSQHLIEFGFSP